MRNLPKGQRWRLKISQEFQLIIPKRKASIIYVRKPQIGIYNASLDKCIEVYNRLPAHVKDMTTRQFKKYIQRNSLKTS